MTDWKEITDPEELFRLKREGWEIEFTGGTVWNKWSGSLWNENRKFRARPSRPKMKKVKILCWYDGHTLFWLEEDRESLRSWIHIPAEDKEIEVPYDN